jgi:hypothetical protein
MLAYSYGLEKIGDEIHRLWKTCKENKMSRDKKTKELFLLSKKGIEKAFEIYYHANKENINELMSIREKIREESQKAIKKDPESAITFLRAINIVENAMDLTHLALMRTIKED